MNKSSHLKLLLSFLFCLSSFLAAYSQCPGPLACTNVIPPQLAIQVDILEEPAVCGEQGLVRVRIGNLTGEAISFPCQFHVCLDEPGENDILFTGLAPGGPNGFTPGGLGSSHGIINTNGFVLPANVSMQFFFRIKGACSLMDLLASGSTDEFENNSVSLFSCYAEQTIPANLPVCFEAQSESFNIVYNLIAVEECNTTQEVNIGIPFSMEYNFAVTGDFCVDEFEITVDFPSNMDISGLVPSITAFGGGTSVPILGISPNGNTVIIDVGSPPGVDYCNNFFNGTFDNLTLTLDGLILEDCDTPIPVIVSTNSCSFPGKDATCYDPDNTLAAQSSATCFLSVPFGDPNLSLVDQLAKGGLDFCEGTAAIRYNIAHSGSPDIEDNAHNLSLTVSHWQWMTIHGVFIGTTYYPNGSQPSWVTINGTTVTFNFGNDNVGISGLVDLDGDGGFDELPIGDDIFVRIRISSECPFENDVCQSNLFQNAYSGTLRWDNQCKTNPEQTSAGHLVRAQGGPGYFDPLPGPIVPPEFDVTYCTDNWICTGMDVSPFDLGAFSITFNSDHTIYPKNDFQSSFITALTYTAENGERIRIEKNPKSPANAPTFTFLSMPASDCVDLHISVDCPPEGGLIPVSVEFSAVGTWEECPDCEKKMGCAATTVLVECPCDPDVFKCKGCDHVNTESFEIKRTAPASGTNTQAAYMCDEVVITTSGNITNSYNGNLYGCYGFFGGTPDFFDASTASAEVFVDGNSVGFATYLGAPVSIGLGGSTSIDFYPFEFNDSYPAGADVEFVITTTVPQGAINTLSPGAHPTAVFGSLGEQDPTTGAIIKCDLFADFFNFYRIDSQVDHTFRNFNCNTDTLKIPFRLEYTGGTGGDDFPGEDRPVNHITDFNLTLPPNSNFTIIGIQIDGNAPIIGTSFSNFQNLLPPNDKVGNPGISQQFEILLLGSCLESGGSNVTVSGNYEENIHSSDCNSGPIQFSRSANFNYRNGGLSTEALNTPINTVQRCIVVNTQTWALDFSAHAGWIQFEFDPSIIESITPVGGTIGTVATSGTNPVIWSMSFPNTIEETPVTNADFEICFEDACDFQPLTIPYYVGKVCEPDEVPNPPVPHTNTDVCFEDEDAFVVTFEESGLNMLVNQCNEESNEGCETTYYSVTLENLAGSGNTGDIHFGLDVPPGFEVVSLHYTYPFNASSSCQNSQCSGTNISNLIGQLTSTDGIDLGLEGILTGFPPNVAPGELPGVQSGMANEFRRVNFCVGIQPTCDNITLANELNFFSNGRRPCGATIDLENTQFLDGIGEWYIDFDADIVFQQDAKVDCESGEGTLFLEIYWPPGLVLPPTQTVVITGGNSPNININFPIQITVSNFPIPQVVEIPFTFDPRIACRERGEIKVQLETYAELKCGEKICTWKSVVAETQHAFALNNGWIAISDMEIDMDLCPEDDVKEGDITFNLHNYDAPEGKEFTAVYYCDSNEDGIPDGPEFATVTGTFPAPGTDLTVILTIDEADFWAACPDGKIMAILKIDPSCCICVRGTLFAEICCECPEYDFNYTWLGGNSFEFFVEPDSYVSLLYCWHDPNGDDVFISTTDNPFIIDFDTYGYVPDEVCVRVESDYLEDCDNPEGGTRFDPERSLTDPPCSEKFCRPMKECYADLEFECDLSEPVNGMADITLTANIQTNMSPYQYYWEIDGNAVGFGSPFTYTLSAGAHVICLVVTGEYMKEPCKFKECKKVFIEDPCKGVELDAGYDYKASGPNNNGTYNLVVTPNMSGPGIQHEWYLAISSEGCEIGEPLSVQYGSSPSFTLQPCTFYILIHKVIFEDCEACFKRCFWICEGRSQDFGDSRAPFDCAILDRYRWPASKPGVTIFNDFETDTDIPSEIFIQPNPADNYVNVSWSFENATELRLFDLSGKMITKRTLEPSTTELTLETNSYRSGIYLIKVLSAQGEFLVKKFEIQH